MNDPIPPSSTPVTQRVLTGISGLDNILHGGLDPDHMYLVEDRPGTGKTTLALQYLLTGVRKGERGLYITLSESESELRRRRASIRVASRLCSIRPKWN